MRKIKTFSVEHLLGMQLDVNSPVTVNYRQGKRNQVTCARVQVLEANCTGRRLLVKFSDASHREVLCRRVYFEHFEKIAEKFGVDI
jgi:hypothetical protein